MIAYWIHSSISYPLAKLMRGLLPTDDVWPEDLPPHSIEHFNEHGAEDDAEWLQELHGTDCVVVVCLGKTHRVLEVFKGTDLRFVNLPDTYANMNRFEQAHFLTGAWSSIVCGTHKAKRGRGFKVAPNGRKVAEI